MAAWGSRASYGGVEPRNDDRAAFWLGAQAFGSQGKPFVPQDKQECLRYLMVTS